MQIGCGKLLAASAVTRLLGGVASPAFADPCEAIQQSGPLPAWVRPGARFSGVVRYVVDGDGLCIGNSLDSRQWVEVRLADFYAPEINEPGGSLAKAAMSKLASGRPIDCRVADNGRVRSYDRIVAVCRLNGRSLSDLMRLAGVKEGGRGRRR